MLTTGVLSSPDTAGGMEKLRGRGRELETINGGAMRPDTFGARDAAPSSATSIAC